MCTYWPLWALSLSSSWCKCIELPAVGPVYSLAALVITWRNTDENEWIHNTEDNLILHKKDSESSCCLWHGYAFNGHNLMIKMKQKKTFFFPLALFCCFCSPLQCAVLQFLLLMVLLSSLAQLFTTRAICCSSLTRGQVDEHSLQRTALMCMNLYCKSSVIWFWCSVLLILIKRICRCGVMYCSGRPSSLFLSAHILLLLSCFRRGSTQSVWFQRLLEETYDFSPEIIIVIKRIRCG